MSERDINQKVLIWARGKEGQQVGAGECWDLADRALRHAGAQSSTTTGKNDDYVWGNEVALKDVQPGDILQFRDFSVKTRTDTETKFDDGSTQTRLSETLAVRGPTHTAIVDRISENGDIVVLEQHVKPRGKRVQVHTISPSSRLLPLKVTRDRIYDKASGKYRLAKTSVKVIVEVTGKIWAYRPKPR